jgi:hypothetical protein
MTSNHDVDEHATGAIACMVLQLDQAVMPVALLNEAAAEQVVTGEAS